MNSTPLISGRLPVRSRRLTAAYPPALVVCAWVLSAGAGLGAAHPTLAETKAVPPSPAVHETVITDQSATNHGTSSRPIPEPQAGLQSMTAGQRLTWFAVSLPDEWKNKLAVGKVGILSASFYGVPWQMGVAPSVRVKYPLKNRSEQMLHVLAHYRAQRKGGRGTSASACYQLAAGEERRVDILLPFSSTDGLFSLELGMLPLDRPPTKADRAQQVALFNPLPIASPAVPTGKIGPGADGSIS